MKRILTLGFLVATFALFANVETASADHRSCYRSNYYWGGHYGSPYDYGRARHRNYRHYDYGYNYPRYRHHHHHYYGGSNLYLGGRRGGVYLQF
ncbi:MAG TPA: hypothetical protein VMM56_05730 [Planctomycetaceae bacterium]|nr:hypothetical protein [Planctomycetaceae bacterium]